MQPVSDFFAYCVADSYVGESVLLMALLIVVTCAIGSVLLHVLARLAKERLTYKTGLAACVGTGIAVLIAGVVTLITDFCFALAEDLLLAFVVLVALVASIGFLRRLSRMALPKAALLAVVTLVLSYVAAVLILSSLQ
ncbi:MAG TPA: hypothetical protein VF696_00865 [Candidatus Paceibacterota bacterium]|jgi:hypothetical protein